MSELKTRERIVAACLEMNRTGINQGTSGNISVRWQDGMLITPTSMPYDRMTPDDIVYLDMEGRPTGANQPSSEWRFHRDIMRAKPEVGAIVHAHPMYSTIIAIMGKEIPPLHYMVAIAGGHTIPLAPYATFGSAELSQHAVTALKDRTACLLQHHGMIATGPTLDRAMWLAVEVETLAQQFHGCLQVGGPPLLSVEEIDRVRARMSEYGHRPKAVEAA